MIRETVNALLACLVTFVLCAVAYPAAVYAVGHTLFPHQAEGSLIERDGKTVGSALIAQPFASDRYFSPRPSAAGANGYAADAASGSNLGTTNPALHDRIALESARQILRKTSDADLKTKLDRLDALQADLKTKGEIKEKTKADEEAITKLTEEASTAGSAVNDRATELGKTADDLVPVDLVTTSGGGLDPEISPEAARYQAARVAASRNVPVDRVIKLIEEHVNHSGAFIGAPARVNVLELNLDLDKAVPVTESKPTAAADPAPARPSADPAPVSAPIMAAEPKPVAPAVTSPEDIAALAKRVDRLQETIAAAPWEGTASEIEKIKSQVAKLAGFDPAPSAKRIAELDARVEGFGRDLQTLRNDLKVPGNSAKTAEAVAVLDQQVRTLRAEVQVLRQAAKKDAMTGRVEVKPAQSLNLAPAVALFRDKNYADAAIAFRELATAHPEDARTWYFAALARGLATNQWKGEAEELVAKGMDCERAGSPPAADINAAFADLVRESGKDWLAYYRARVTKP